LIKVTEIRDDDDEFLYGESLRDDPKPVPTSGRQLNSGRLVNRMQGIGHEHAI